MEFKEFPKIARLNRESFCTEKVDGTNGQICIEETMSHDHPEHCLGVYNRGNCGDKLRVFACSKSRFITPKDDNAGFAKWVQANLQEIAPALGPGSHVGEWFGSGIQRGYGLKNGDKRFLMFNVSRWCLHDATPERIQTEDPRIEKYQECLPACIGLVPILYRGLFDTAKVIECLADLKATGSRAVPGYAKPEGIVAFHTAGSVFFKATIDKDDVPKSLVIR